MASHPNTEDQISSISQAVNNQKNSSLDVNTIMSRAGTVRGIQEGVKKRRSLFAAFGDPSTLSPALLKIIEDEKPNEEIGFPGKIVYYTTSLHTIRERFDKCNSISSILRNRKIKYEEKDVYLNPKFHAELKERMQDDTAAPPLIFFQGEIFGDDQSIFEINETGQILEIFGEFMMKSIKSCLTCGDKRFILCDWCQGSKKGTKNKFSDLKCTICNVNGLIECPKCRITKTTK